MSEIEATIADPTCPNCGAYLSGDTCDKCGIDPSDYAEVEIYKLFRKWRTAHKRPRVTDAWRAGYDAHANRVQELEEALKNVAEKKMSDGSLCWCLADKEDPIHFPSCVQARAALRK